MWKLRELQRVKRDIQEQKTRDYEIFEIERRRNMTDEQVQAENEALNPQQEKSKIQFLQKYYHKGAFFADEDILKRDYNEPTPEDMVDKAALPEVLQVKKFGFSGRTKWTHLTKEDTSRVNFIFIIDYFRKMLVGNKITKATNECCQKWVD